MPTTARLLSGRFLRSAARRLESKRGIFPKGGKKAVTRRARRIPRPDARPPERGCAMAPSMRHRTTRGRPVKTLWPFGLRADYDRDVARLVRPVDDIEAGTVRDRDLAHLPASVRRYLQVAGVVGQPHVHTVAARMHGRIRGGPAARWMPHRRGAAQRSSSRRRVSSTSTARWPACRSRATTATSTDPASMLVRLAALIPVAARVRRRDDAGRDGDAVQRHVRAGAGHADVPAIAVGAGRRAARPGDASRTAGHTIGAELSFGAGGELVDFQSDDRCPHRPRRPARTACAGRRRSAPTARSGRSVSRRPAKAAGTSGPATTPTSS